MANRKVVASVSFAVAHYVEKRFIRDAIKLLLSEDGAFIGPVRVNFDSWGEETTVQKAPAKRKKTVLQAGKAKGKGKGKGGPKKPAKPVKKAVKRAYTRRTNGAAEPIKLHTEL